MQDPEDLYQFVAHQLEGKGYYCTICSKSRPKRMEVWNHVESIHFPDTFCYQCNVCAKEFISKNALKVHNATVHTVKGDSTYRVYSNLEQNCWILSKQELQSTSIEPSSWIHWDNWIVLFQCVNENSFGLYPLISAMTLNSPSDLLNYVEQCEVGFQCSICGKTSGSKREARNHVESIHFPSSFVYECDHCGRQFNSLNTRNVHISRNHKKKDLMMEGMMWLENSSSSINLSKWHSSLALNYGQHIWWTGGLQWHRR